MDADDKSHFLIYRVLGVSDEEGNLIDVYQNKDDFFTVTQAAFWRTQRRSASSPHFLILEHFGSRTRKAVDPKPSKSTALLKPMHSRSSGVTRPPMATISPKNILGFRRSLLLVTRQFESCSTTRTESRRERSRKPWRLSTQASQASTILAILPGSTFASALA